VDPAFASILDWRAFSLRVPERDAASVVRIVRAVPPARVAAMQDALGRVWHRFAYVSHPAERRLAEGAAAGAASRRAAAAAAGSNTTFASRPHPFEGDITRDDAFATILQFLHSRMAASRAGGDGGGGAAAGAVDAPA